MWSQAELLEISDELQTLRHDYSSMSSEQEGLQRQLAAAETRCPAAGCALHELARCRHLTEQRRWQQESHALRRVALLCGVTHLDLQAVDGDCMCSPMHVLV